MTDVSLNSNPPPKKKPHILVQLWPIYVILGGLALVISQGWHEYLTLESMRQNIGFLDGQIAKNFALVFVLYMAIYAACTAFMVPASFLTIAGGALFGLTFGIPLFGALGTVIGATVGASILFVAAKTSIGEALRGIAGPFISKMEAEFNASPLSYMFVLRLVPAVPFAVANIAPSLLGAKFRDYVLTTFFGIMPGTLAYSWIGGSIGAVIRDPNASTDNINGLIGSLAGNVAPALIALFVVALIPVIYKRFFQKKPKVA